MPLEPRSQLEIAARLTLAPAWVIKSASSAVVKPLLLRSCVKRCPADSLASVSIAGEFRLNINEFYQYFVRNTDKVKA